MLFFDVFRCLIHQLNAAPLVETHLKFDGLFHDSITSFTVYGIINYSIWRFFHILWFQLII